MILGTLSDSMRYYGLHPLIQRGFEFLRSTQWISLPDGRVDIDGDHLFAIVARGEGRGPAASPLEFHRRYADIQYVVAGEELIGWAPTQSCISPREPFVPENDIGFFSDVPKVWFPLGPGQFAIFYPEDAHAPLAGSGPIHKVVVKVEVG